ncbi:MAG TPA: hypothetical protein VFZ78_00530, partial [Flavisolibacter sp.]
SQFAVRSSQFAVRGSRFAVRRKSGRIPSTTVQLSFNYRSTIVQPLFNYFPGSRFAVCCSQEVRQDTFNHRSTIVQLSFNHRSTIVQPPFNYCSTIVQPLFNYFPGSQFAGK